MDEAKKTLEKNLENRPEKQELLDHNILKSDLPPALQDAAAALEKKRLEDALKQKLDKRPSKGELEHHNILQGGNVAPAIAAATVELESKIAQKQLKHDLKLSAAAEQ